MSVSNHRYLKRTKLLYNSTKVAEIQENAYVHIAKFSKPLKNFKCRWILLETLILTCVARKIFKTAWLLIIKHTLCILLPGKNCEKGVFIKKTVKAERKTAEIFKVIFYFWVWFCQVEKCHYGNSLYNIYLYGWNINFVCEQR